MNDFQNSLLETMQMFSSNAAFNAKNSPIINGEIIEVIDAGLKTYKVKYQENEFSAISAGSMKYSIGEIVYILVPDGDFSKDKFILGSLNPSASSLIQSGDSLKYYDISENLFNINEFYELNSHKTEMYTIELDKMQSKVLSEYLQTYRKLAFGFAVRTELAETQVGGNYGMRINIPVLGKEENASIKTFTLDLDQLLGTPYSFREWSPQSIFFTLEDRYNIDTKKNITIDYFCSDFPQNESIDINDIFFKDIFFKVVEEYTEEDNVGYKLTITSDSGNYFLKDGSAKKKLSSTLKVNGDVTSFKGRPCYWLIEDSSVKPGHKQYLNHAGRGWRLLQQNTEVLEIDASLVLSDAQFRCIVLYDDYVISDTIYIKNLNTGIEIDVFPTKGNTTFMKDVGEVELTAQYYEDDFTDTVAIVCIWERYDRNHTLISTTETYSSMKTIDGKDWIVSNLKFPTNEVEGFNTVKCSITKNGALVGSRELSISTTENWEYRLVIENGNKIYKYDSDGDSPMEANYDGPVSSALTGLTPLNCRIFKVDGTELTENEYEQCWYEWRVPVNSMFELEDELKEVLSEDKEYYIIQGRKCTTLPYQIAKRFDKSKAENNIQLRVDFLGKILDNIINISFLKEGASGTNGTKYTTIPVMVEDNGNSYPFGARGGEFGYVQKMHFVYNTELKTWYWHDTRDNSLQGFASRLPIGVLVYEDGNLLKFGTDYKVFYKIFDENATNPCFTVSTTEKGFTNLKLKKVNGKEIVPKLEDTFCNIIQAEITITRSGNESAAAATTVLYAYYPIELTITNIKSYNNMKVLPTLNGGFSEVLYATDGTNPQYDSTYPFSCSESVLEDEIKKYYSITWDAQHHLHEYDVDPVEKAHGILKYKPSQKYDDGNSKNYVKAILAFDAALKDKLTKQIEDSQNQIVVLEEAIEDIDNIRNSVVEAETKYINYNFENEIQTISSFLKYREQLYKQVFIVDEYLYILEDYLKTYQPTVRENCDTFDTELKVLRKEIALAKQSLIDFNGYDFITELDAYAIAFEPLKNDFCLYELNRGIATTIDAYILDINQAILVYKNLFADMTGIVPENLRTKYKNIIFKLKDVYNTIRDEVSIKNTINQYIEVIPTIFNETELLEHVKAIYSTQIVPYLATDMTAEQVNLWNEEIKTLGDTISKANKILATEGRVMSHIRPIVLTFNRYGMSNINSWDGNKIYTGDNEEFLLAPQVGAGYKEEDNSFTGMVMGLRNITSDNENATQTGLFGYHKGQQSVFLNAKNGSAIFGKAGNGGQIIIDPNANSALLYSSNYWNSYDKATGLPSGYTSGYENGEGMLIDLSTPSIKWGNGNFSVNEKGYAHIGGGGQGDIGGWNIYDDRLESANRKITLHSKDKYIKFADANGKLYSDSHGTLGSTADGFYLSHDGLSIGSKLRASNTGKLELGKLSSTKHWTIDASDDNSYISYGTKGGSTSVYLGTDQLSLGKKFKVTNEGILTAEGVDVSGTIEADELVANSSGTIGNWSIGTNTISSNGITLNSNTGTITGTNGTDSWEIKGNGSVTFNKGTIGGWTISSDKITGGNTTLNSSGTIKGKNWSLNNDGSATIGNFSVDASGNITASGGTFSNISASGNITASTLTANESGYIGGIAISAQGLSYSGSSAGDGFGLWKNNVHNHNGSSIIFHAGGNGANIGGAGFRVYQNGAMYATSAHIEGEVHANSGSFSGAITATSGTFSNCTINDSCTINCAISGSLITNGSISSGKIAAGAITADKIDVDNLQSLSSSIGGWSIDSNGIYKSVNSSYGSYEVRISSQFAGSPNNIPCISAGGNFKIFATGSVQCSSCECGYLSLDGTSLTKTQLNKLLELID